MFFPAQPYTRERSREETSGSVGGGYVYTTYGGTVLDPWKVTGTTNYTYSGPSVLTRAEIHDVVTVDWLKKQSKGIIVNNPMESYTVSYYKEAGSYYRRAINRLGTSPNYYYNGSQSVGNAPVGNDFDSPNSWALPSAIDLSTSHIAEAITEAWSKVSCNEAEALVQIAESKKTLYSLVSIFRRAYKIFRELKRLELGRVAREFSPVELKNRYMELRYALRHLLYDTRGLIKVLSAERPKARQTFRAYRVNMGNTTLSNQLLRNNGTVTCYGTLYSQREIEVRAGVLAAIEAYNNGIVSDIKALGLTEPIEAIWEIIPFSFIVDWFFNVGKIIASWTPNVGMKTLASWYSVIDVSTLSGTVETATNNVSYNYTNIAQRSGNYSKIDIIRYRLPNPDRPILPRFAVRMDFLKTLDLGIIAGQIAKLFR